MSCARAVGLTHFDLSGGRMARMKPVYDHIGIGYTKHRCADLRIAHALVKAIGLAPPAILADIGSGTGNYSRAVADLGYHVKAVEPSIIMYDQAASHDSVDRLSGFAERIPLADASVDGVFCVLASHHFSSLHAALGEMARICPAGPIVWFTFDPRQAEIPWLQDYFPALWKSTFGVFPPLGEVCNLFETRTGRHVDVFPWPIPFDLQDCFMAAGWRRPEMYLDPEVRSSMSAFALADQAVLGEGLSRLKHDIATGAWRSRHRDLLERQAVDWGYRFLRAA